MSIGVLLVDDHAIIREGLRSLLERQQDMEVLADAKTRAEEQLNLCGSCRRT